MFIVIFISFVLSQVRNIMYIKLSQLYMIILEKQNKTKQFYLFICLFFKDSVERMVNSLLLNQGCHSCPINCSSSQTSSSIIKTRGRQNISGFQNNKFVWSVFYFGSLYTEILRSVLTVQERKFLNCLGEKEKDQSCS